MASATMKWFGKVSLAMLNKEHDWLDDVYKVMGTTVTYTPDQDAHDYKDDVTNEVSGTGYTATGQILANKTIGYTAGTNVTKLDCDDPSWGSSTISGLKNLVVYNSSPSTDATRPLLCYGVLDTAVSTDNGTLAVNLDTAGLLTTTAA